MALESQNSYAEKPSHEKILSTTQETVVNTVLKVLEKSETNKKVGDLFGKMFDQVAANDDLFAKLMKSAGIHEERELKNTELASQKGEIKENEARKLAEATIQKYTKLELFALKRQYELSQAA